MKHLLLMATAALACGTAFAQQSAAPSSPAASGNPQVIEPQVQRRDVKLPKFPSRDIEFGIYGGLYATENFGSAGASGLRLGYHITEDFFVSASVGRSKATDEAFRQIFPGGGIVPGGSQTLTYYSISAGYNLINGEAFFGRNTAKPFQVYLVAGVGSTEFVSQKKQTVHVGFGGRLYLHDRFAIQADVRNHMFPLDLLGKRTSTHNPEVTVGITTYF
jgi:outer membrane beta-barrel protein